MEKGGNCCCSVWHFWVASLFHAGYYYISTFLDDGNLIIEQAQERDIGKYECVAENEIGVAYSSAAMLYVKGKVAMGANLYFITIIVNDFCDPVLNLCDL